MTPSRKAVTAAEIAEIENRWFESGEITVEQLMERVGQAISDWVLDNSGQSPDELRVLVLVGKGNNGGDALIASKHLSINGTQCVLGLCMKRENDDPLLLAAIESGAEVVDLSGEFDADSLATECLRADVILDGVFGFSFSRPIDDRLGGIFKIVIESGKRVVAIDVPSGADPDTGRFDPYGLPADSVLPIGLHKIGPAIRFGDDCYGDELSVLDVGMPGELSEHIGAEVVDDDLASTLIPDRRSTGHKGDFGTTLIYGGSANYVGAAAMATRACLRSGVGLVILATPQPVFERLAGQLVEAIFLPFETASEGDPPSEIPPLGRSISGREINSCLIGPGIGLADETLKRVGRIFESDEVGDETNYVLDADALNIAAKIPDWWSKFNNNLVITPHPGEMARLMGCSVDEVEADRLGVAREAASRFNCVAVLKGAVTLIVNPGGDVRINMMLNDGLAKGGSGDVLAGLVAGLAAQIDPFDAAVLGVRLHSIAGDIARQEKTAHAMKASDVIEHIPDAFIRLAS